MGLRFSVGMGFPFVRRNSALEIYRRQSAVMLSSCAFSALSLMLIRAIRANPPCVLCSPYRRRPITSFDMNQTSMSPQTSGSAGSAAPRTAAPSATREYSEFLETNRRQDRRRPQTRGPLPALAGVFALLILWSAVPALSDEPGAPQPPAAVPVASQDAGQEKRVGTVTMTNVDDKFIQNGGSCVLSSYAIVGNYFTGKPISAFFEGYCRHFGIAYADAADAA